MSAKKPKSKTGKESRLNAIISRGYSSAQELLELDFGKWPPPGIALGPAALPEVPIVFKNLRLNAKSDADLDGAAAFYQFDFGDIVDLDTEEHIAGLEEFFSDFAEIDGTLFPPAGPRNVAADLTMLGHESIHVLQWVAFSLDRFLQPEVKEPIGRSMLYGHGLELDKILASEESSSETAQREIELLEGQKNRGENVRLYYLSHIEIQARLHQILVAVAPDWPRLPETRQELSEALEEVLRGTPARSKQFPIEGLLDAEANPDAHAALCQLRENVIGILSPAQQEAFFKDALPSMYGSLRELYGDAEGRSRLGFYPSPVYARAMAAQLFFEEIESGGPAWSQKRWNAVARKLEPDTTERLTALAEYYENTKALKALKSIEKEGGEADFSSLLPGAFPRLKLEGLDLNASYRNRLRSSSERPPLDLQGLMQAWNIKGGS